MAARSDRTSSRRQSPTKYFGEEEVLKPVDKDLDPDDWPLILLEDAIVYRKDGITPVNLLHAELEGPFTVRGKVTIDRDQYDLLLSRDLKSALVEVNDVRGFSTGILPTTIWARGKSGWFEIRPTAQYQNIYGTMAEGVLLYFFLIEIYEDFRSQRKGKGHKSLDLDTIFDAYAIHIGEKISRKKMIQRCGEQAAFLISQMRKAKEPIAWKHTSFYKWLVESYSDVYEKYKNANSAETKRSASAEKAAPSASQTSHRTNTTIKSPAGRSGKSQRATVARILGVMNDLHTSGTVRAPQMNLRALAKVLFERFELDNFYIAQNIIRAHAKSIFDGLGDEWSISPIYHKLEEYISTPTNPETLKERAKMALVPREPNNSANSAPFEFQAGTSHGRNTRSRSDKSSPHRPSPSPQRDTRSRKGGKGAGKGAKLRLQGTSLNPQGPSSSSDSEVSSDVRGAKRRKVAAATTAMDLDEPEEEAQEGEYYEEPDADAEIPAADFDEFLDPPDDEDKPQMDVVLESKPLLSASPQGPNGLWTCQREGCDFMVWDAGTPEGRQTVQGHFLDHADEIERREQLVVAEARPYLPINNLLEKLRGLGEAARLREQEVINGRVVPQPNKRRLMA